MVLHDQKTYDWYRSIPVDKKVFITEYSRKNWGYNQENSEVIYHGIDTEFFKPSEQGPQHNIVLSVANEYVSRGNLLGFPIWQHIAKDVPCKVVGNTPGLSKPAKDQYELLEFYQNHTIFLNTSTVSPIPHSLLEAASVGCAIATTLTCAIPEFFVDGVNCVASNDPETLKQKIIKLMNDPDEIKRLGKAARQTILEKFNLSDFTANWEMLLRSTADMPYRF
jgi:glycosyltransferase involved in cell wall biosynthesis